MEYRTAVSAATGGGRLHPITSRVMPCGYLDGLVARRDRKTLEAQKTRRTIVRLAFVVSGGYLSFRALRTWSRCVADGAAALRSLCLSRGPSLYHPPDALGPPVSQAKAFHAFPEARPGRINICCI